ncbi:NUDIX domain-containing protein [Streptomyces sp. NPDC091271]|uniref:NUDIX domain-containing protein n=1 Tax=Streptomyces sp. NPDC091271 TaxID=3365980 RepID=UPI00382C52A0
MSDEAYGALRATAAPWVGTSVLITNTYGKVLIQHVDYRDTCLLPGGAVAQGESPAHAATRELMEELGVAAHIDRGLAVDWVPADAVNAPASMRFPGEILHVFDGGTWDDYRIAEIRLPPSEITGIEFVEPARLPDLLSPADARRALVALRARINAAGTVLLENGRPIAPGVLDRLDVLRTARPEYHYPWHQGPAPIPNRAPSSLDRPPAPSRRVGRTARGPLTRFVGCPTGPAPQAGRDYMLRMCSSAVSRSLLTWWRVVAVAVAR